jgi:hypothetical protein
MWSIAHANIKPERRRAQAPAQRLLRSSNPSQGIARQARRSARHRQSLIGSRSEPDEINRTSVFFTHFSQQFVAGQVVARTSASIATGSVRRVEPRVR